MPTASRFQLGRIVATPAALRALTDSQQEPLEFLRRHAACDWGDLGPSDKRANFEAIEDGGRIFSAYHTRLNVKLWIITEAENEGRRDSTCLLLPSDY